MWTPVKADSRVENQGPDIRDEEILRLVFLHIFELELWKFLQSVFWQGLGSFHDDFLDSFNRQVTTSLLQTLTEEAYHRVQVLHDVLKGRVRPELLKQLPFVEQRIHQVGVVV